MGITGRSGKAGAAGKVLAGKFCLAWMARPVF